MSRFRVPGGETNEKTGRRWTKDELLEVLQLYISVPGLKVHEENPLLIELGRKLGRTTRSVEAQLLMFRNLDKFGMYGYKNMSSICRALWKEYIDAKINNI